MCELLESSNTSEQRQAATSITNLLSGGARKKASVSLPCVIAGLAWTLATNILMSAMPAYMLACLPAGEPLASLQVCHYPCACPAGLSRLMSHAGLAVINTHVCPARCSSLPFRL